MSLLVLALLLCGLLLPVSPAFAAGNDVYFSTPYITTPGDNDAKGYVDPGQTFYVDIIFDSNTATRGGGAGFYFDGSLVQVTNVSEGDFYSSQGFNTFFDPGTIYNSSGNVSSIAVTCTNNDGFGATGTGIFATIEMQALTGVSGTSSLEFAPDPQTGLGDIDANELSPALTNGSVQVGESTGPVSVSLQVTGNAGDIIGTTTYTVPDETVTEDGFTINAQTAMGMLVYYCQANSIDIELIDGGYGVFVNQIGTDTADAGNWSYALEGAVPMTGAADQAVANGETVHWFNYNLGYYNFALSVDPATIGLNQDVTFTVTYTDGTGAASGVTGAEVFVSDTLGSFGPETGTSYGTTDTSGELTIAWSELGTFYPYATYGSLTSQYQYPTPEFTCSSSTAGGDDTVLHGETVAQLEVTVPDDILSGWLLEVDQYNEIDGVLIVKSNAPWEVTVEDSQEDGANSIGLMSQYDIDTPAYGVLSLGDALHILGDGNDVDLLAGVPVKIADGVPADQEQGNAGETIDIVFQQYVEYDDPILVAPYDTYRIVITFTASQTF